MLAGWSALWSTEYETALALEEPFVLGRTFVRCLLDEASLLTWLQEQCVCFEYFQTLKKNKTNKQKKTGKKTPPKLKCYNREKSLFKGLTLHQWQD